MSKARQLINAGLNSKTTVPVRRAASPMSPPNGFSTWDEYKSWSSAFGTGDIQKSANGHVSGLDTVKAGRTAIHAVRMIREMDSTLAAQHRNVEDAFRQVDRRKSDIMQPVGGVTADHFAHFGEVVLYDPTRGSFAIRLPKATRDDAGKIVVTKNTTASTNAVTVRAAPERVDGGPTFTLSTAFQSARFYCDGQNWWTI